jgi:hypothetical protein
MRVLTLLALLTTAAGCGDDFTSYSVIERLRILGVRASHPEVCPLGEAACPPDSYREEVEIAILAADADGIVADGLHPGGPYLRTGHEIDWALCAFALRSVVNQSPDCTLDPGALLTASGPVFRLTTAEAAELVRQSPGEMPGPPGAADGEGLSVDLTLATAVRSGAEREWALKALTLSDRDAGEQNVNPRLDAVTLGGLPLRPGEEPCIEVETGHAYRVEWEFPESSWQTYRVEYSDRIEHKKELYHLSFFATAGSFSGDTGPLDLWMGGEIELFWRPPLEVPAEGLEVTLAFNLFDARGGSTWTWGRVRVVRGDALLPR